MGPQIKLWIKIVNGSLHNENKSKQSVCAPDRKTKPRSSLVKEMKPENNTVSRSNYPYRQKKKKKERETRGTLKYSTGQGCNQKRFDS